MFLVINFSSTIFLLILSYHNPYFLCYFNFLYIIWIHFADNEMALTVDEGVPKIQGYSSTC